MLIAELELASICTFDLRRQQLMAVRRVADDVVDLARSGLHEVASGN